MKRLDIKSIAEEFNERKNDFHQWGNEAKFLPLLQQLSQIFHDMRAAGLDVSLNITGDVSNLAFRMFPKGITVPIEGIVRIGANERLLAIAVKDRTGACLKLALSELDIRHDGMDMSLSDGTIKTVIRSNIYDLNQDPDALIKFQKEIIRFSARNEVIFESDIAEAFEGTRKLRKNMLKPAP